jgi:hypothetical protein
VLRAEITAGFAQEHGMAGKWDSQDGAIVFYRQVTAVDPGAKTIRVDLPTRYALKTRDQAAVAKGPAHISEVGVEGISVGMREARGALGGDDHAKPGTAAYDVHASAAIVFNHVVDGWVQRVHSYKPAGNGSAHLLSGGISLRAARSITVQDCVLERAQYQGAGGNGYLYILQGAESLFTRCVAKKGRHNFSISSFGATGNVINECTSEESKLNCDFHQKLSPANLIDAMLMKKDRWEATFRTHQDHGHGTTESVFWNVRGDGFGSFSNRKLVYTGQFKMGYAIGTSGTPSAVGDPTDGGSGPKDWVEGAGKGEGLSPRSLYRDQLDRREAIPTEDLPESLRPGQTFQATITVRNTTQKAWTRADGFKLGARDDSDPLTGATRHALPQGVTVQPGQTHTFTFPLTAPAQPGTYVTDWQMLQEGVEWFGPVAGASVSVR